MAATLMSGTVTLTDGSVHAWKAGPRERIKAERVLGIRVSRIAEEGFSEEYLAFLIYESLMRDGDLEPDCTFDLFIDQVLDDYEADASPESVTPPA